jgi:hypothetical protein
MAGSVTVGPPGRDLSPRPTPIKRGAPGRLDTIARVVRAGSTRGRIRGAGWLLVGLVVCAAGLRLAVAWGDLEGLVRDATPDDAYYYFQIARSAVAGRGASLDGETPTNGFHPLWLACLMPVTAATSDRLLALRVGLSLGALLGAAAVALAYAILRALGAGRAASLLAAGAWALHPTAVRDAVNGLETSLAVATQGLATWLFVRLAAAPRPPSSAAAAALGLACGLAMLARTDAVFLAGALVLGLAVRGSATGRGRLRSAGIAAVVAAAAVAPWLAWNWVAFGSIVQVSARAVPEPLQRAYLARHGSSLPVLLARAAEVTLRDLGRAAQLYLAPGGEASRVFAAIGPLLLGLQLLVPAEPARRLRAQWCALALPAVGIATVFLVHTGVRWWTREWYYAPLAFLAALALGLALDHLGRTAAQLAPARARAAEVLALGAAGLALFAALGPHARERWGLRSEHRVNQLEAARWLAHNTPPEARIGAFNAGILSYFAGRTVVNLDGAVNADALRAREAGRLAEYVLERRVDHLADFRSSLRAVGCAESSLLACEPLALVGRPLPQFGGRVQVLRVRPR